MYVFVNVCTCALQVLSVYFFFDEYIHCCVIFPFNVSQFFIFFVHACYFLTVSQLYTHFLHFPEIILGCTFSSLYFEIITIFYNYKLSSVVRFIKWKIEHTLRTKKNGWAVLLESLFLFSDVEEKYDIYLLIIKPLVR